ncbi:MAG TPA: VIT and VWA domain-containing protein [Candidatus Acidoferrales bacterium]|jgi:Ca-activated chloride channel family protein|nr:VIT and VWA domain-containing protein [Candidatus Acidoferrales bacterium]
MSVTESSFAPIAASTGNPLRLAMQRLWLTGQVLPAGGRLVVQHVFRSDEDRPLEVIYCFPLPRDAALRGFRITGAGFTAHSELKQREDAVRAYEQGMADGSLAALALQYGDGLVNLTVGNVRPAETVTVFLEILAGVELRDDGFRFRFPFALAPAYHSKMRASAADAEGEMELPAGEFGDLILPRFRLDASSLHEIGFDLSLLHQLPIDVIGSPSHAIKVKQDTTGPARVALAPAKDVPNRDLILDVRFKESKLQVLAGPSGDGKRSFAAVVPSTLFGQTAGSPRRIVMLLDRSGSMEGEPIAQARKAIEACLAGLSEDDSFGLMAFDDRVEAMHPALVAATREQRECARIFLKNADARGGTELALGVRQAAQMLGGEGDILIITDGQVLGTEKILADARATGIRLSCLGIGSASQDRFLGLLARETGGVSRFVTARERVDLSAVDLFASMGRPVAAGLKAGGNVQPEPPGRVFAGTPVLLYGEVDTHSDDRVELTWDGGSMSIDVPSGDRETGEAVRLLRGSRLITDWESRYPSEKAVAPLEKREQSRVAAQLFELSKMYGLASREMSLVAVVKREGDRPGELPDTRVVPVGMAQDTAFRAYFGGGAKQIVMDSYRPPSDRFFNAVEAAVKARPGATPLFSRAPLFSRSLRQTSSARDVSASNSDLMDLAAMLEPDGGMPGDSLGVRAGRTIAALFTFVAAGHTLTTGAFRLHLTRLATFLKSLSAPSDREARLIETVINAASTGKVPTGPWLILASEPGTQWQQIEEALQ